MHQTKSTNSLKNKTKSKNHEKNQKMAKTHDFWKFCENERKKALAVKLVIPSQKRLET